MSNLVVTLTLLAGLGCGLVAGVLFAFSSFVMRGLARLTPAQGIAAMQAINAAALTPLFMTALLATATACLALIWCAVASWGEAYAGYLLAGSATYLVGAIGLTIAYHVPRNEALARLEPDAAAAPRAWGRYQAGWTAANHIRTVAALAAAATLTLALTIR